jgi:hypothetical protein
MKKPAKPVAQTAVRPAVWAQALFAGSLLCAGLAAYLVAAV